MSRGQRTRTLRRAGIGIGLLLALTAMGCSSDSSSKASSSSSPTTSTTTGATSGTSASSPGASTGDTLGSAQNAKVGKAILVDGAGNTVYLYVPDGTSTTSKVPASLQALWPAVTANGSATAGSGLDSSKLVLEPQSDGSSQVSYNGHLLYTFANDHAPGDANGEGLGQIWYVLGTDGNPIM